MTRWLLLICVSCLVLSALASPVLQGSATSGDVATGRQAAADAAAAVVDNTVAAAASPVAAVPVAAAPVPASTPDPDDDEEDDDDDDDDVDLDITDDDDDDDDEEENETAADDDDEDDDDDYDFERFFDDLLGDDDDDDEEEESAPSAAPLSATPAPAATQPALTGLAASNVDYNSADYNAAPGEAPLSNDANDVYDEDDQESASNTVTLVSNANAVDDTPQENAVSPSPSSTGDDDDDEDDDDIDLSVEDDEEEDDDEGDDDDDEDDDEDDDTTNAAGRAMGKAPRARALSGPGGETVAPAYIAKYNRFIDTILMRVNKILKKSYDPVNVRLQSPVDTKKKPKPANTKKNKNKTKLKTKRRPVNKETRTDEVQLNRTSSQSSSNPQNAVSDSASLKVEPKTDEGVNLPLDTTSSQQNSASPNRRQQRKRKVVKTKTKVQIARNNPRAKATLYGLSSMRRDGDVTANVMRSHTTVRAKFLVGPLTLKVEKEFGRGVKKELRSATATTAELVGKLNLRVVQGGSATLHSIRVLQPKQVRIDTGAPDDNDQDQTREFMWKRSSNIAHLVSEKLTAVTRAMLQPPPQQTPAEPAPLPIAEAA